MKYCSNCGGQVEDDDIYCGFCGSKLKDDAKQEKDSSKQDFEGVAPVNDDLKSSVDNNFDKDFEKELNKEFDDEFGKNDDAVKNNTEFESYVEHGNPFRQSTSNNNTRDGHKQLMSNKFAKDANTYGILALIFGLLGGILGIVFGIIGLIKAKKALELCNTGEYDGKPKASNARILSILGIVSSVLWIIYYIL